MLSRNAYAIAFNFASFEGNRDRLNGLDSYDAGAEAACSEYSAGDAEEQEQTVIQLNAAIANHAKMSAQVRCINTFVLPA